MSDVLGAMFLGEYQHTLDPKGRVILPSAFRESLKEGLVMTVGIDHCVEVHPAANWKPFVERLRDLRTTSAKERAFVRMILSSAQAETPDRQGRVNIPARLRTYASLGKDVTVVGQDTRVEIWDSAAWARYQSAAMEDFANTEQPFNLGAL